MSLRTRLLGFIIWVVYRTFHMTWRVQVIEPPDLIKNLAEKKPVIFSHFHGDELALILLFQRYPIATIVSSSADGSLMDFVVRKLGGITTRGSSTRGGIGALKGLLRLIQKGYNTSFAVDGPKGPIHKVKPGVFEVSRLSNIPIYAAGVYCDRFWRFEKSWNKTYFPKPFAKITIIWKGPVAPISKDQDPRDIRLAEDLENRLLQARTEVSKQFAVTATDVYP